MMEMTSKLVGILLLSTALYTLVEAQKATEEAAAVIADELVKEGKQDPSLLYGFISPLCWDALVVRHQFTNVECIKLVVSKMLGYAIIGGSLILKLPQILKIVAAKDVTGLTPASFYLEVALYLCSTLYNVLLDYPISTWGENVIILTQNIILVLLLWAYSKPSISYATRFGLTIVFAGAGAAIWTALPEEYYWVLLAATIPVSIVARIPQIVSNFQQGHTGQLAMITLVLNLGGSVARLFTTLQETGDTVMLIGFGVGAFLNGMLVLQVVVYWTATNKALASASMKKTE